MKPKKYSRTGNICSCEVSVASETKILDNVMIKYEIMYNNKQIWDIRKAKYQQYFGEFKQIVELPKIFDKIGYKFQISSFNRDNVQIPVVSLIMVDGEKYELLKLIENRKDKLKKLNKL